MRALRASHSQALTFTLNGRAALWTSPALWTTLTEEGSEQRADLLLRAVTLMNRTPLSNLGANVDLDTQTELV
jgi:hypothetical protein